MTVDVAEEEEGVRLVREGDGCNWEGIGAGWVTTELPDLAARVPIALFAAKVDGGEAAAISASS